MYVPTDPKTLLMRGRRILLRAVRDSETVDMSDGGIYIPDPVRDRQKYRNWIVADGMRPVGLDVTDDRIRPGARVVIDGRFAGQELEFDDGVYRVVLEDHLIAILEDT